MANPFDDLIPPQGSTPRAGAFDDLIPSGTGMAFVVSPPEAGPLRTIADSGIGIAQGAAGLVKGIADNYNAGENAVSNAIDSAIKYGDSLLSNDARGDILDRQFKIDRAQQIVGESGARRAALNTLLTNPRAGGQVMARGAGSVAPTLAMGAIGVPARFMGGINAASTAGSAAEQTADALRAMPEEVWMQNPAYRELRASVDHATAVNELAPVLAIPSQVAGGAVGALSGSTGLERAITSPVKAGAGSAIARLLAEQGGEQIEEIVPLVAGNATARAVDGVTPLNKGIGQTVVDTAVGGAPGAGLAAVSGGAKQAAAPAPQQAPADIEALTQAIAETARIDSKNAFTDLIPEPSPTVTGAPDAPQLAHGPADAVQPPLADVGRMDAATPVELQAEGRSLDTDEPVSAPQEIAAEIEKPDEPKYPVPDAMTGRATQIEAPTEGLRPGDIVAITGKPFATKSQAQAEARQAGKGWVVKKGGGGFVVRHQPQTDKQIAATRRMARAANNVDTEQDSMFAAIAKLGGIHPDYLTKEWGFDAAELKNLRGSGIKRVMTRTGKSLDAMAESLAELGYLSYDENGKHDLSELSDLFDGELRGNKHYTPQGFERRGRALQEEEYAAWEARRTEELSDDDIESSGWNDLPEAGQDAIEELINEFENSTEEDEAAIAAQQARIGATLDGDIGEIRDDAGAEEVDDGSASETAEGAPRQSGAGERARNAGQSAGVDPDADIPLDGSGDTLTEAQRNDPDYVPFSRGGNEARKNRDAYTQDMFGAKLPDTAGNDNRTGAGQAAEAAFDVDTSDAVPESGRYASKTRLVAETTRTLGATRVTNLQEAAQALSYLGRGAVERFDALVTDKDGRPLAIVGAFKGGIAQTSVIPATVISEAFRIKGAANIWMAHNHPSGRPDLSAADRSLEQMLRDLFRGSGIEARGLFAIASSGKWSHQGANGDGSGSVEQPVATMPIKVVEREISEGDKLADKISGPMDARRVARSVSNGESGIMLLDSQNQPLAFVPVEVATPLREGGRMDAIYRAISYANAATAIIVNQSNRYSDQEARNLAGILNSIDVRALDVIDVAENGVTESRAEHGESFGDRTFMSRGKGSGMTVSAIQQAIATDIFDHDVDVYATIADAPEYVRIQAARESANDVEGFWDMAKNRVALIAENIDSAERARQVARHELIGHYGIENMLQDSADPGEMARLVKRVIRAEADGNKVILDLAAQVDRSQPDLSPERRAKEIIAIMAERNIQNSITKRVIDAIRKFLRKIGFIKSDVTDAEIAELLREAQAYLRSKGREMEAGEPAMAFSRLSTPIEEGRPLTREEVLAKQQAEAQAASEEAKQPKSREKSVSADQVDMFNEQGSLFSRADVINTSAFRKWFGDSKVVDAEGRPLVVYHGTRKDFTEFKPNDRNGGIFLTANPDVASIYAGPEDGARLMPSYVRAVNPLYVHPDDYSFDQIQRAWDRNHDALITRDDAGNIGTIVVFDPTQIKSATGNRGTFDPANPNIAFSRSGADGDTQGELDVKPTRDPITASDMVSTVRDVSRRRRWAAGTKAYSRLTAAIEPMLAKVKLSNDAPAAFKQMMRQFEADQQKALANAKRVAETGVEALTAEERVMISDIIEKNLAANDMPPEAVVRLAADIEAALQQQAQDLIDLGMASEERLIRNYLPRAYRNPLLARITSKEQFVSWYQKAKLRINGNRLKSRGLVKTVAIKDITKFKVLGWKISSMADGEDIPAPLLDALEADKTPPPEYATRDMKVLMWRDFTADEREKMGEIRDGVLRYAMGYTDTQRDIAIGRLFKAIAEHDELSSKVNPGGWTKVPDQKIPGTELKRYGALSGLYVSPYVRDVIERSTQPKGPLMQVYDQALAFWKEGKTIWNPVSHGNNIISNVFTMHYAGLNPASAKPWRQTLREYRIKGAFYQEAVDNGLFGTEFASKEIQELFMPDLTGELDAEVVIASRFNKVINALKKTGKPISWYRDRMQKAYEFEDQFFKLMLFIDRRSNGASIEDAITDTERYVFNYSDVPEGVQLIKRVYSPFFSYTYKALPMLVHTAMTAPHRLLLPVALLGGANWLAYALMGGDEEEERNGMPDYLQGRTAVGTQKAVRMPFNIGERPAFMDMSRRVPMGDLFDMHNQAGGLAVPAPFMPSHPLFTGTAAMLFNLDTFTGKELVKKSDTDWEAAEKRSEWLWKQMAPNAPFVPGSWNFDKLMNGSANAFDTEMAGYTGFTKSGDAIPLGTAFLDVFGGTKIRSFDPQRGKEFESYAQGKERREIQANIRSAMRNKSMSAKAREEYVSAQRAKLKNLGADE